MFDLIFFVDGFKTFVLETDELNKLTNLPHVQLKPSTLASSPQGLIKFIQISTYCAEQELLKPVLTG